MIGRIGIQRMLDKIHYVFGLMDDYGGKPWSYIHYLSVKSASIVNSECQIHFWYQYEPSGYWWDQTKPFLILHQIEAPNTIFNNPLLHHAHKADILRLQILKDFGGIYIDSDVICLKPFNTIDHCGFWMCKQYDYGLCNATMGSEPNSEFIDLWYNTYTTFRSRGWDPYWDEHSVKIPRQLSSIYPHLITVLEQKHCFVPFCYNIQDIFHSDSPLYLQDSYSVHLWETISWDFISKLTPDNLDKNSELGKLLVEKGMV